MNDEIMAAGRPWNFLLFSRFTIIAKRWTIMLIYYFEILHFIHH